VVEEHLEATREATLDARRNPDELAALARARDLTGMQRLLDGGVDVNGAVAAGGTALVHAAAAGFDDAVALLLDAGASLTAATKGGRTALMMAAERDHDGVVEFLLERGAPVDAVDAAGWSAAILAAQADAGDAIAVLARHGANLELRTFDDSTPGRPGDGLGPESALQVAVRQALPSAVKALLAAGADVTVVNARGYSVEELAASGVRKGLPHAREVEDMVLDEVIRRSEA
jgi:ankyrin repeat protein